MNHNTLTGEPTQRAVVVGQAVVLYDHELRAWVLPGGLIADNQNAAHVAAQKMDRLMRSRSG